MEFRCLNFGHTVSQMRGGWLDQLQLYLYGGFRKLGVPYFGVLMIRILVFRLLH